MFGFISILLLMAIFCQLIAGSLAMSERINFSFGWLTFANFVFICCVTFALVQTVIPKEEGPKCGLSQMAPFFLGLATLALQLFIVILQLLWVNVMKSK